MIHMTKQLDLTESPLCINLIVESISDFLNCNALICFRVHSRTAKSNKHKTHKRIKLSLKQSYNNTKSHHIKAQNDTTINQFYKFRIKSTQLYQTQSSKIKFFFNKKQEAKINKLKENRRKITKRCHKHPCQ